MPRRYCNSTCTNFSNKVFLLFSLILIRVEIMFSGLICKDNTHAWLYVSSPRYKYITFSNGRDITCRSSLKKGKICLKSITHLNSTSHFKKFRTLESSKIHVAGPLILSNLCNL